jgi:4'-phosphopantetheinyl transferase
MSVGNTTEDIQVWLAVVDGIDLAKTHGLFSHSELARADRLRLPLLRQRFLARRWMARALLGEATGEHPRDLVLESRCARCDRLHPASPLIASSATVWWSSSSSEDLAAVAISPWRIGLDIEKLEDRPRWGRIAERFYTDAERCEVAGSATRFLEFWTMKEAYLKANGVGLAGGLRSIDCSTFSSPLGTWRISDAHPGWQLAQLRPQAGFIAAVAVMGAPHNLTVRRWLPEAPGGES